MSEIKSLTKPKKKGNLFPWQERPKHSREVLWRYTNNPIIGRYHIPSSNSIFNSAVVPFKDGYAGVFRCDDRSVRMNIHAGFSKDGLNWNIDPDPIQMQAGNTTLLHSEYKYDPRVVFIEDRYWVGWCNGYYGPTIGLAYTFDFKEFFQCENAFLPFNRNGVLFPKKINGKYAMLSRPSDNGHTAFGDIFISYSPDMKYWGEHRKVLQVTPFDESGWQSTKLGAGPIPGAALLDTDQPDKVLCRSRRYLLGPAAPYELSGDVPNVVFPCAALTEGDKLVLYYGAADTCVAIAFGYISEIINFIREDSFV